MSDRMLLVLLFPVLILALAALADLAVRRDLALSKKLFWALVILVFPAFGATVYLFVRYRVFHTIHQAMR